MHNLLIPKHDLEHFEDKATLIVPETPGEEVFGVNGYHFAFTHRKMRQKPADAFAKDEIMADIDTENGELATIIARPHDLDTVSSLVEGSSPLNDEDFQPVLDHLLVELKTIAQYSGMAVELMVTDTRKMVSPRRGGRTLFVVMGSVPPGLHNSRHATHLFGTPICRPNYRARLPAPTADIGYVVKNDFEEPIAQIVGQTIYLFLPLNSFGLEQLVDPRVRLFRRGLSLAWNALHAGVEDASDALERVLNADDYAACSMNTTQEIERLQAELSETDEQIASLQVMLAEAIGKRRVLVTALDGTRQRNDHDKDGVWEMLQQCPYLDCVIRSSEHTVYYRSTPIIMVDEDGVERYVGQLGLHIEQPSNITVWSFDNPHPSDIPHPHVSRYGDVCLGNVTQSVCQLLADMKEPEAATLVLRFLAEGYDPVLTEHKLTEWPTPKTYERRKDREPLPPVPHVKGKPNPSGDDSGSRLNRLLRGLRPGEGGRD